MRCRKNGRKISYCDNSDESDLNNIDNVFSDDSSENCRGVH